ncbi:MAG: PAS domain S-box protein [Opitutaceae bacterium]|nr:PAS domain S-box protein [Opitutaceae bacterium]
MSAENLLGAWSASVFPVYCRDAHGRLLAANRAFLGKFARPEGEPPRSAQELLHPEDTPMLAATLAALRQAPFRVTREQRWRTTQGWRWMTSEEIAVFDPDGRFIGVQAVGFDITRQRVAEELYLKLSRAVEQSPVAIVITDAEGRAQYVNPRYTQISGHTLEDILEQSIPVLREGHPNEEAFRQCWLTVSQGGKWHGELTRQNSDGRQVWESVQVSGLRNPAGDITNFLCLREDITERRRLEHQLRQAQKMESLGTLAGGIAHDFNNLLAVINGYAELSLSQPADSAILPKSLGEIQRAAQRASGLVRQILTFSRKTEIRFAPVDLNQLARDLVALLGETFPRNVAFHLDLAEQLPPLLADQNQLQQIVLNLCVNARDAMPAGGVITLGTAAAAGKTLAGHAGADVTRSYACLHVGDTGTGMTPEVRARLFEPFFTTKPGHQGTGLGLAVVYGIVASHQGVIEVDSTPGIGSTFRVYLPLAEHAVLVPTGRTENFFPGGSERLLVVDDEISLRRLLATAFTRKGYTVHTASDGLEAIQMISDPQQPLDAALLDLNMPGATGLEVLKVIKACRPLLRVLVLSGHVSSEIRAELDRLGQADFVQKPYTLDDLGRRLRALLDTAR